MGVELGLIKKSGAWFTYEGEQLGQVDAYKKSGIAIEKIKTQTGTDEDNRTDLLEKILKEKEPELLEQLLKSRA